GAECLDKDDEMLRNIMQNCSHPKANRCAVQFVQCKYLTVNHLQSNSMAVLPGPLLPEWGGEGEEANRLPGYGAQSAHKVRGNLSLIPAKLALFILSVSVGFAAIAAHPLDPLSTNELRAAVEVLIKANKATTNTLFPIVALREPPKEKVLSWQPGSRLPREALVTAYELSDHRTYEAVVNLDERRVAEWRHMPNVEPPYTLALLDASNRLLQTNELWLAALRRRGITNAASVDGSGIPFGLIAPPVSAEGVMVLRNSAFTRNTNHMIWEPIEGLEAVFDMSHRKVLQVIDREVFPRSSILCAAIDCAF
ncbi:MAG: hypothetical protein EXS31_00470, partial [Pedosphaera sp.]|nr:hypothetical protein [Pedosphaera sp.]